MKKIISVLCTACLIAGSTATAGFKVQSVDGDLVKNCKSAYLMDYDSGECVYKQNETVRMPIASVCKVMTLTLVFDAVSAGKFTLDDKVSVSERAMSMGGSQIFLDSKC